MFGLNEQILANLARIRKWNIKILNKKLSERLKTLEEEDLIYRTVETRKGKKKYHNKHIETYADDIQREHGVLKLTRHYLTNIREHKEFNKLTDVIIIKRQMEIILGSVPTEGELKCIHQRLQ